MDTIADYRVPKNLESLHNPQPDRNLLQVFDSLPESLQDCFQSGDVQQLIQTAQSMKPEDFQYHFDRCKLSPPRGTQAS